MKKILLDPWFILGGAIANAALWLALAFYSPSVKAGPLEDFQQGYAAGTALQHREDYKSFYAETHSRSIVFEVVRETPEQIDAKYHLVFHKDNVPQEHQGVVRFKLKDGVIEDEQHVRVESEALFDYSRAGQAADVISTAVGLSAGLSEANPIVAGAISSPAGALAMAGLKIGLVDISDKLSTSLHDCVANRRVIGSLGWGAAAWNVGVLVHPFMAILGGIVGFVASARPSQDAAAIECIQKGV